MGTSRNWATFSNVPDFISFDLNAEFKACGVMPRASATSASLRPFRSIMCFNVSPSILIKNFIKLLKYLKIIKEILL